MKAASAMVRKGAFNTMADIFLSYTHDDLPVARRFAESFEQEGFNVWWDQTLRLGEAFDEATESALRAAKAVVVLWSKKSAASRWVRAEATLAQRLRTLVPAMIEACERPIMFELLQTADLSDWRGKADDPAWLAFHRQVRALVDAHASADECNDDGAPAPVPSTPAVLVLPFLNMSGDPEQEYFSDGVTEDVITDLSKVSALAVTARNTAFAYKGKFADVKEIARRLGVTHVLEGSVRKSGDRVRITAQLISGATGNHLWAERYDRDLVDIFAIQDEISEAIVAALKLQLLPTEKEAITHRGTANVDAYNLYLMSRQYWITGDFGDRRREERVVRLCRMATEIDGEYAQAWALMALAQSSLFYGFISDKPLDDGMAAADRALALNSGIAEAHLPRAWHFAENGLHEDAAAELAAAVRLGPSSWEVNKEAARLLYRLRKIDDATRYLEQATRLVEDDFHGWGMLMACYIAGGNEEGAHRCAQKLIVQIPVVLTRTPENGGALIFGALAFAAVGDQERARAWIDRALLLDPKNVMMRYNLGWGLAKIFHDEEAAVKTLETVFGLGGRNVIRLAANDPNLDHVRADPRFAKALDAARLRVGLT
jgi:adenylate cyclase